LALRAGVYPQIGNAVKWLNNCSDLKMQVSPSEIINFIQDPGDGRHAQNVI
jgi:hypothetical protein